MNKLLLSFIAFYLGAAPFSAPASPAKGQAYDPGTPTLDLAVPPADLFPGPRPVVVIIHGGGWARGDKADKREKITMEALKARGYAAVSINYALFAYRDGPWKGPLTYDAWPRNINDIFSVLAWLKRAGPNHRLDPDRVALLGYSAGGHLALLAAYGREQVRLRGAIPEEALCSVKAVISAYGIHDLKLFGTSVVQKGAKSGEDRVREASPANYLGHGSPPTLVIHGDADQTIPFSAAQDFEARLAAAKCPHALIAVPGGRHGFALSTPQAEPANNAFWAFLAEHLK